MKKKSRFSSKADPVSELRASVLSLERRCDAIGNKMFAISDRGGDRYTRLKEKEAAITKKARAVRKLVDDAIKTARKEFRTTWAARLRGDDSELTDSSTWPSLAEDIYEDIRSLYLRPSFYKTREHYRAPYETQFVRLDVGWDWELKWTIDSLEARTLMDTFFAIDCALHPKLWKYLRDRLPVLGEQDLPPEDDDEDEE